MRSLFYSSGAETKTDLFLLPNIIVDGHFATLPLLPSPLLGVAADVVEFLVGHLQVVGEEEVHLLPVQAPEHVQHAAVVVQSGEHSGQAQVSNRLFLRPVNWDGYNEG